jgi:hypothetical protein
MGYSLLAEDSVAEERNSLDGERLQSQICEEVS